MLVQIKKVNRNLNYVLVSKLVLEGVIYGNN